MAKPGKDQDKLSDAEAVKRGDEALKRALKMPPKPYKPKPPSNKKPTER